MFFSVEDFSPTVLRYYYRPFECDISFLRVEWLFHYVWNILFLNVYFLPNDTNNEETDETHIAVERGGPDATAATRGDVKRKEGLFFEAPKENNNHCYSN